MTRYPIRFLAITLSMAAGGGTLLRGALQHSRGQSIGKVETPLQVAQVLDCVLQPRFENDAGQFGMSRIVVFPPGHEAVGRFQTKSPLEQKMMAKVQEAKREYAVMFLRCAHRPGKFKRLGESFPEKSTEETTGKRTEEKIEPQLVFLFASKGNRVMEESVMRLRPSTERSSFGNEQFRSVQKATMAALPRLQKGEKVEAAVGNWLVALRPVHASRASCLSCHKGAKPNDTLGVLVYAVSKTRLKSG